MVRKILMTVVVLVVLLLAAFGLWQLIVGKDRAAMEARQAALIAEPTVPMIDVDEAVGGIKQEYKESPQFRQCAADFLDSCLGGVINQEITKTGNIDLCDDFVTDNAKTNCRTANITRMARENADATMCDQLADDAKLSCQREVVAASAIAQEDLGPCDALEDNEKRSCITQAAGQIARATKDAGWCDKIPGYEGPNGIEENFEKEMCQQEVQFMVDQEKAQQAIAQPTEEAASEGTVVEEAPTEAAPADTTPAQ